MHLKWRTECERNEGKNDGFKGKWLGLYLEQKGRTIYAVMQASLLVWLEGREQKTSKEKRNLQLHLQNAIVAVVGASLKVVCGAEWRGKKGVDGKNKCLE